MARSRRGGTKGRLSAFAPRQDQGEHEVRFQLQVGKRFDETRISRAAQVLNTPPCWQVYYPQPEKADRNRRQAIADTVQIDDPRVQVVALKKAEKGNELIIRLRTPGVGRGRYNCGSSPTGRRSASRSVNTVC